MNLQNITTTTIEKDKSSVDVIAIVFICSTILLFILILIQFVYHKPCCEHKKVKFVEINNERYYLQDSKGFVV